MGLPPRSSVRLRAAVAWGVAVLCVLVSGAPSAGDPAPLRVSDLLPNGDFEQDSDVDGIPDGWFPWRWLPEEEGYLRRAVLQFLGKEDPSEELPRLDSRRPYFGKRSLRLPSRSGRMGPGVYCTRPFPPGAYTLTVHARTTGPQRFLAIFLAQRGRLAEVGRIWRRIVLSERIRRPLAEGEISLRDWTFAPGDLFVDHASLVRLPFDIDYPERLEIGPAGTRFLLRLSGLPADTVVVGVTLEELLPSGRRVRKNIEPRLAGPSGEVGFTLDGREVGVHRLTLELYDPRSADLLYRDDGIVARVEAGEGKEGAVAEASERGGRAPSRLQWNGRPFFPIGMSVQAHEVESLAGRGFNAALLLDAGSPEAEEAAARAKRLGLALLGEIPLDGAAEGQGGGEDSIATLPLWGAVALPVGPPGTVSGGGVNAGLRRLRERLPGSLLWLRGYLPGDLFALEEGLLDALAVDPFPVTIPARPLTTLSDWIDGARRDLPPGVAIVALVQCFGGWPVARRAPTPEEVRALTYLALAHGAQGIVFHAFSADLPFFEDPVDPRWDIRRVPALWDEVTALAREVQELSRVLLQGPPVPLAVTPPEALDAAAWAGSAADMVIAVNVSADTTRGHLAWPGAPAGRVEVVFEGRQVPIEAGLLHDTFAPLGVHVYRAPRGTP